MDTLFSPLELPGLDGVAGLMLPNRIVLPPMCQYSAIDGCAGRWHQVHYGQMAASGAGLLIVEATAVSPEGRISPADVGLYNDTTEKGLADVVAAVRAVSGIPLGVQLAHAGRKASTSPPWKGGGRVAPADGGWETVAPSAVPYRDDDPLPTALDEAGLEALVQAFAAAARRADRIGMDVIEIHAAHGYLLHEFLSPLSNMRTDAYGGTPEKRMRFPLEVFDAVRAAVPPHKPVGVRISATDWTAGGWDLSESITFSRALEQRGCAFIHVSGGGLSLQQQISPAPGYQVPLAAAIRAEISIPVIAVGLITEPQQAATIVAEGQADLVAIGRGLLYNPRWPWHAAAALGAQITIPPQYWRSAPAGEPDPFLRYGG